MVHCGPFTFPALQNKLRINNFIRAPEVQVITDEGKQLGVMKITDALRMSREMELDLVEVGPNVQPPIVKIMDYGKYQYLKSRQEKKTKAKTKDQETKTVRVGFKTGAHDIETKARKTDEFLQEGHPVKVELTLRGREKALAHMGLEKLKGFLTVLSQPYITQGDPKRSPFGWVVMIQFDKKRNNGTTQQNKPSAAQ